jgi:thiamine-phosphate pyrophosphorylase
MPLNPAVLRRVLITDRALAPDVPLADAVQRAVDACGITLVVVRELDLDPAEQVRVAKEIIARTGVPVLMARNPDLAREAGAAGVQLGWDSPTLSAARAALDPEAIVGVSVHSVDEGKAASAGADYLLLGPVLPTPKPHGLVFPVGFEAVRELAAATTTPVVAVGGLDLSREAEIRAAGAAGIAAIRAFMAAAR